MEATNNADPSLKYLLNQSMSFNLDEKSTTTEPLQHSSIAGIKQNKVWPNDENRVNPSYTRATRSSELKAVDPRIAVENMPTSMVSKSTNIPNEESIRSFNSEQVLINKLLILPSSAVNITQPQIIQSGKNGYSSGVGKTRQGTRSAIKQPLDKRRIILNVRGSKFDVTIRIFDKYPESRLTKLISNE